MRSLAPQEHGFSASRMSRMSWDRWSGISKRVTRMEPPRPCEFSKQLRNRSKQLRNPERTSRANPTYKADHKSESRKWVRRISSDDVARAGDDLQQVPRTYPHQSWRRLPSRGAPGPLEACTAGPRGARRECQESHRGSAINTAHPLVTNATGRTWRNSARQWNQAGVGPVVAAWLGTGHHAATAWTRRSPFTLRLTAHLLPVSVLASSSWFTLPPVM